MKLKMLVILILCTSVLAFGQVQSKSVTQIKMEALNLQMPGLQNPEIQSGGKKKAGVAIFYSLILPGMGELYAGDYSFGQYLTIADCALWLSLFGFDIYGSRMENNYKSYAETTGGSNIANKNEKYFADLGNYMDIDQYNRRQELDRNFTEVYNTNTDYWKWASQAERKEYRRMWKSSENAYNNIRFAAGALILNRIVSVINSVRLVSKHNKSLEQEVSMKMNFGIEKNLTLPTQLVMNMQFGF